MGTVDQPLLRSTTSYSDQDTADFGVQSKDDLAPIQNVAHFFKEFYLESKKLWFLAGPSVFTLVCQYTIGALTQIFAGHLGTLSLDAISVENSVIQGFSYGILMGMASALETLCGQAYGASQVELLGIFMQRSWVILNITTLAMVPLFVFGTPILRMLGQTPSIAREAGKFARWMIPQQFAYALMLPLAKFLQAQSRVMAMAVIAAVGVGFHAFLSWLLMMRLGWELSGAAVVLDASWWFITLCQLIYAVAGFCGKAWSGFSWKAFHNLGGFVKLSLASALMLCLEIWYVMALTLVAGYLKNPEVSVAALSICINILGWGSMVALGFNVAISVRVSNELGSGQPRRAKFSVVVVGVTAALIGLLMAVPLLIFRRQYPAIFSTSEEVKSLVQDLTPLLAVSIIFTNAQYGLCGVAIGAGWQSFVAYLSTACYFFCGVPLGVLLSYKLEMGVKGLWYGMASGLCLQCTLLFWMVCATDWYKEASIAEGRLKQWVGEDEAKLIIEDVGKN